jgi:hypothetical protein
MDYEGHTVSLLLAHGIEYPYVIGADGTARIAKRMRHAKSISNSCSSFFLALPDFDRHHTYCYFTSRLFVFLLVYSATIILLHVSTPGQLTSFVVKSATRYKLILGLW